MEVVFADTFFFIALLNRSDTAHARAIDAARVPGRRFITLDFVLLELGDALHKASSRSEFEVLRGAILSDARFEVIPATRALLEEGIDLYQQHQDKDWQLTDCISFAVMKARNISHALTGDRHFEQAGFIALLR